MSLVFGFLKAITGDNEGVLCLAQRDLRAHSAFDEGGEAFAFLQDVFSRLAQAG